MSISIGKWRRLQQTASPRGTFCVLAIDHRGPVRRALEKEAGSAVPDERLSELKQDVVRALGSAATAVLLDPETGVGPCIASGALDGHTGLITALDTGSTGDPLVRETGLVEGWSVQRAAEVGAAGVKLLIYYHPESAEATRLQQLVQATGQACAKHNLPFFLEPLSCSADLARRPLPPDQRCEVVLETARRLVPLGVDVLKAEFPVDVGEQPDQRQWRRACEQLSDVCPVPWVLLSAGVSFDTFLVQTRVACDAGASGVMVGRAVWKESVTLQVAIRNQQLNTVGRQRMLRLRGLCDVLATPFMEKVAAPNGTVVPGSGAYPI